MRFQIIVCGLFVSGQSGKSCRHCKGLYQVREPVTSQAPEERDQATQRALIPRWCCA